MIGYSDGIFGYIPNTVRLPVPKPSYFKLKPFACPKRGLIHPKVWNVTLLQYLTITRSLLFSSEKIFFYVPVYLLS